MKPYAAVLFYSLNELIDSFGDQNVQMFSTDFQEFLLKTLTILKRMFHS